MLRSGCSVLRRVHDADRHRRRHPALRGRGRRDVRCGWASCPDSGASPGLHRDGEHPDAVHPDGVLRHRRRDGVHPHRRPGAAGHRHDDRAGACPATARTGCCPDAADDPNRGRRHDRSHRGGNPCPATGRRGCCLDGGHRRDGRPKDAWCRRTERQAASPDGARVAFPASCPHPGCPAGQERGCSARPGRQPPPERNRWRTVTPAVRPERRGWTVPPGKGLRVLPGRAPREQPGQPRASGPTAQGPRGVRVRRRSWPRRNPGMRREASSRRGPQWWMRLNGRTRPVPAVSQLRLSRLYRALSRARVRGPWPHFSCLGPHRVRHEPSISYF